MDDLNQNPPTPELPEQPKKRHQNVKVAAVIFLVCLAALAAGGYFYSQKKPKEAANNPAPANQNNIPATTTPAAATPSATTSPVDITGDAYGLFVVTQNDKLNNFSPTVKYQDDGIIESGKYAGFHRLAAYETADDPSGGYSYIFATKDYQTFILDTGTLSSYQQTDYNSTDSSFNKTKVVSADVIYVNQPATISLDNFVLVRDAIFWDPLSAKAQEIASGVPGLNFFTEPLNQAINNNNPDAAYLDFISVKNQYVAAFSDVYVQDQAGLIFIYNFRSVESYNRAQSQKSDAYPPAYQNFYLDSDITAAALAYKSYGSMFIYGCASPLASPYVLQNISDSDLVKIGQTKNGVDLYIPKDINSPVNKAEYYTKVTTAGEWFKDTNKFDPPSFADYAAKNPVLVFKDAWGRWTGVGETEIQLVGGCGKPVIYLYPQKPTEVTVKFLQPMNFTVDIPAYAGQWDVLANPDGELKDLRPEVTDCNSINYNLEGSRYAQKACASGIYPYLYWAGQTAGTYPSPSGGWVVAKNNLQSFLEDKLTAIGLNQKEKADMAAYWVPELLAKNAPYYRLSFFQAAEMDKFIPMQVNPKPDTTIRVFLDWSPLQNLPEVLPEPQVLQHLNRQGFTLVEWGGLKQ